MLVLSDHFWGVNSYFCANFINQNSFCDIHTVLAQFECNCICAGNNLVVRFKSKKPNLFTKEAADINLTSQRGIAGKQTANRRVPLRGVEPETFTNLSLVIIIISMSSSSSSSSSNHCHHHIIVINTSSSLRDVEMETFTNLSSAHVIVLIISLLSLYHRHHHIIVIILSLS